MAEREHFTNGRTWTFGTGFGLMSLAFGAQVSSWSHWITIGAGYGTGVVLMLGSAVLITKSYFSRHPEFPGVHNTLPPPEHLKLPTSPSKLVIHSAYFGVEGGPDEDVAEKYLRPRILGHALAGWVGADLFGALDPAIGVPKRLKVRYSYEGREAIIERRENELLVLPEDPQLKQAAQIPSAVEVKALALAIVGDLCAFLKENGKPIETPPHVSDGFAGLGNVPDDIQIKRDFPGRFASKLADMKARLGGMGLLDIRFNFSSISTALGNPQVSNAEDVREIIRYLEMAAEEIKNKYIGREPMQIALPVHAMDAPTSIEFRDQWAKTQHLRVYELGLEVSELFTPLQIEAFDIAKDLRALAASKPRPVLNPRDFGANENGQFHADDWQKMSQFTATESATMNQWCQEIRAKYALSDLQRKAKKLYLRFVDEAHIADHHLASLVDSADTDEALLDMAGTIRKIAFQLEDVKQ